MSLSKAQIHWSIYESPIGPFTLVAGPGGLTNLNFPGRLRPPPEAAKGPMPGVVDQLEAYFAGRAPDLRPGARPARHIPAEGRMAGAAQYSLRDDHELRRARRQNRGVPLSLRCRALSASQSRRRRQRPQPGTDHRPLPPRDRRRRVPHRLWRGPAAQAGAPRPGAQKHRRRGSRSGLVQSPAGDAVTAP